MKTEKHPFSKVIHYGIGGTITPEKAEFTTLCKKVFKQGHDALMQSGYLGAQNTTCKPCRAKLYRQELIRIEAEKIMQEAKKRIELLK